MCHSLSTSLISFSQLQLQVMSFSSLQAFISMEPKILRLVRSKSIEVSLFEVNLPYGLTCSQCVVQWTYYTGNTWGICANGTEGEQ